MNQGIAIALISGIAIFLFAYLCLGTFGYKKKNERGFSFLSMFPYEMVGETQRQFLVPIYVAIGLLVLSMVGSVILMETFHWPSYGLRILGAVVGGAYLISMALMVTLMVLPTKYVKSHIKVASGYIATSALSSVMSGFVLLKVSSFSEVGPMTIGFVLMALGLMVFAFMLNPRFSDWARLEKEIGDDGSVSVVRPRRFILAYAEWIALLNEVVSLILILIGLLISQ
ncbi:MAG: hypothetical protein MJ239_06750 [Bacilli bacterium]|nr:hypothetical protein [Bacilli bacterium]